MSDLGQIFTNALIADYMVSMFSLDKSARILDPCFGDGAFLKSLTEYGWKRLYGCEIDQKLYINTKQKFPNACLYNTDFLKFDKCEHFDGIIMNPPYIRQEKIDSLVFYDISKEELKTNPLFKNLPASANMYMYFIMKAVSLLREGGELVVIFPSSWENARFGEVFKDALFDDCSLEKRVETRGEVFEGNAMVEAEILKLVKGRNVEHSDTTCIEVKNGHVSETETRRGFNGNIFDCLFGEYAGIHRGLTTGCNEMYINTGLPGSVPVLSTPKAVTGFSTAGAETDALFIPPDNNISESVAEYLKAWKERILRTGTPKTLYGRIKNGDEHWYVLKTVSSKGILFSYFIRRNMRFVFNESGILARDNFYVIEPKGDPLVFFAMLNSYYTFLQLEFAGKRYGAGLLKLQKYDLEGLSFPRIKDITVSDVETLKELGSRLVETGDNRLIEDTTKVMSQYAPLNSKEVTELYNTVKNERLRR